MYSRRRILGLATIGTFASLATGSITAARAADFDIGWCVPPPDTGEPVPEADEPAPEPEEPQEPEAPPPPPLGLLDGIPLDEDPHRNELLPIAVVLDNFSAARPQIGMDRADLVYELLVEGGISRFMAVYLRQDMEWIEPVRSARTPMLYVARELGAVVGHVGAASVAGPADADSQFGEWGVHHFDGDLSPEPFWRDHRRYAPHNAVTSTVNLRGHAMGLSWHGPSYLAPWLFKDDFGEEMEASAAGQVGYGFALTMPAQPRYNAAWHYDGSTNGYLRSMAGVPHRDGGSGQQLSARNVVLHLAPAWIGSRQGHVLYDLIGEGPAYVFRDGHRFEAVWTKPSREERTRYWHPSGEEVRFNRGRTWVALLPAGSPYWWR